MKYPNYKSVETRKWKIGRRKWSFGSGEFGRIVSREYDRRVESRKFDERIEIRNNNWREEMRESNQRVEKRELLRYHNSFLFTYLCSESQSLTRGDRE